MLKHILKKSLAVIMAACCITVSLPGLFVSAEDAVLADKMVLDLKAFEILSGLEDGELHLEREFTRAQLTRVVAKIMDMEDGVYSGISYSDVPETHWAYKYIGLLSGMELVGGYPDGTFMPDNTVRYQEAAKILVAMLGYGLEAEKAGGFPNGYLSVAARIGVLKGVGATPEQGLTRAMAMRMVYNCLDITRMVQKVTGAELVLEASGETYRDILLGDSEDGLMKIEGVVTATREFYLNNPIPYMEENQIEIDGVLYYTDRAELADYFGQNVVAYVNAGTSGNIHTIKQFKPHQDNKKAVVDVDDIEQLSNEKITYLEDGSRRKSVKLGIDVLFLYNGRPVKGNDSANLKLDRIENAVVTLIGNTGKNEFNVVMIDEYRSFVAERVSSDDMRIYLADNQRFNNARFIDMEEEDTGRVANTYNRDGERIALSDIPEGAVVSVIASGDYQLVRCYVGVEELEGVINGASPDDGLMTVDSQSYPYETTIDTTDILGRNALIKFNWRGEIAYIDTEAQLAGEYGAIVAALPNYEEGNAKIRMVIPGKIRDEIEEVESDDPGVSDIPAIAAQNEAVAALFTADEITFDSEKYDSEALINVINEAMALLGRSYLVVSYKLDENGLIKKIEQLEEMTYEASGRVRPVLVAEKKYNAYDKTFGGMSNGAFGLTDGAVAICIPENTPETLDDYLAKIDMKHNQEYVVGAFGYNKKTHAPDVVVFNQEMHAKTSAVYSESKIAVVNEVFEKLNSEGDMAKGAVIFTQEGMLTCEYSDRTAESYDFDRLKKGDIIKYSLDTKGRLDGYEYFAGIDPIPGDRFSNAVEKEIYIGTVKDAEYNYVSDTLNKWVDSIKIGGQGLSDKTYEIPHSNAPMIFVFDTSKARDERLYKGTTDDLLSRQEKAIVISSYNKVRAVIIVK